MWPKPIFDIVSTKRPIGERSHFFPNCKLAAFGLNHHMPVALCSTSNTPCDSFFSYAFLLAPQTANLFVPGWTGRLDKCCPTLNSFGSPRLAANSNFHNTDRFPKLPEGHWRPSPTALETDGDDRIRLPGTAPPWVVRRRPHGAEVSRKGQWRERFVKVNQSRKLSVSPRRLPSRPQPVVRRNATASDQFPIMRQC